MSVIRKIIGFIPALIPAVIIWIFMTDFMNPFEKGLYPGQVPWYMWLWMSAALAGSILLCFSTLIPLGLISGTVPYLVILVNSFLPTVQEAILLRRFAVFGILFYVIYAICYYTYHRELNKP